jgi:hypothetical protein
MSFYLRGGTIRQAINQGEAGSKENLKSFILNSFFSESSASSVSTHPLCSSYSSPSPYHSSSSHPPAPSPLTLLFSSPFHSSSLLPTPSLPDHSSLFPSPFLSSPPPALALLSLPSPLSSLFHSPPYPVHSQSPTPAQASSDLPYPFLN